MKISSNVCVVNHPGNRSRTISHEITPTNHRPHRRINVTRSLSRLVSISFRARSKIFTPFSRGNNRRGEANVCTLAMRANIHRWNSNSDGSFICPAILPPNSGLIIRIIVLIPRQSFASPRSFRSRESITLYTCELPPPGWSPWSLYLPPSSLSTGNSDSHLHLRSFPALSLCTRPFSRSPHPAQI